MAEKQKRSTKLIANFIDGFAEEWHFAVGDYFRDQLDIKYTEKVIKGIKKTVWTQGPYFCFTEGHIFYDDKNAYQVWGEALKHFSKMISVVRAVPVSVDEDGNLLKGSVTFTLEKPNESKTGLEKLGNFT